MRGKKSKYASQVGCWARGFTFHLSKRQFHDTILNDILTRRPPHRRLLVVEYALNLPVLVREDLLGHRAEVGNILTLAHQSARSTLSNGQVDNVFEKER